METHLESIFGQRELFESSESDFQRFLIQTVRHSGQLGDALPLMIERNVPYYIMQNLWPSAWERFRQSPCRVAFAIAETGWRGRIDNLQSRVSEGGGGFSLLFQKSYVISSDLMILAAREKDDFALCYVPRDDSQSWQSRNEPGVKFDSTQFGVVDHHYVQGQCSLGPEEVCILKKRDYLRFGLQIPLREVCSMALLAYGILQYHGLDTEPIESTVNASISARDKDRLGKEDLDSAQVILRYFQDATGKAGIHIHPFWERVKQMAGM
ncbi:MAG: hypothetical protein KDK30_16800 [Leptospiraceae bacterium]|nr:hypothetical protein [Leptospiraceae bacterium]MCB1319670.1 hypothetical protein [Leptospiraceae bacterium]